MGPRCLEGHHDWWSFLLSLRFFEICLELGIGMALGIGHEISSSVEAELVDHEAELSVEQEPFSDLSQRHFSPSRGRQFSLWPPSSHVLRGCKEIRS